MTTPVSTPASNPEDDADVGSLAYARARSAEIEEQIQADPASLRMLTGDRPTGRLHLGHYLATLRNRVRLQDAGVDTFIVIADYQVLTDRDAPGPLRERVLGLLADYLATGVDPARSTVFAHSAIPELNQLLLPFLSLVTDSELRRNPTVKAEFAATGGRPLSGLLLTYPVHQAADILFCGASVVPVGKDQLPHLELARLITRRFHERYGRGHGAELILTPPDALLTRGLTILGLDGEKMSKSRGNTIDLAASAEESAARIRKAVTDSEREITYEPSRRPAVANLLLIAAMCTGRDPREIAADVGSAGAGALKALVTEAVNSELAPVRERRAEIAQDEDLLLAVLAEGNARARAIAAATLDRVREAMGMAYT